MEISFNEIRSREVVNIYDGKRLGHIIDLIFHKETGRILGVVVPGIKKAFRKAEDIFIPLEFIKKIGEDVILVRLAPIEEIRQKKNTQEENRVYNNYVRVKKCSINKKD